MAAATLNRTLTGRSRINPEMALRLSKALGRSSESWLAMQYNHDRWHAKQHVKLGKVEKVRLTAAQQAYRGRFCSYTESVEKS